MILISHFAGGVSEQADLQKGSFQKNWGKEGKYKVKVKESIGSGAIGTKALLSKPKMGNNQNRI